MINLDPWQKDILNAEGNILLCSGRQVGKSTIIAIRSSEYAIKNRNKSIMIISSTERQAKELFIKCLNYLEEIYPKMIMKGKDRPTQHILKLRNGSIIRSLPCGLAGEGIRGFTLDLFIADEAAFIADDVFLSLTPSLLTTGGNIILLSTPHGKKGYFYEMTKNENFKVFHVNSEEVINNRELSQSWTQYQRDSALSHLNAEKKRMTRLEYAQEYMGEFIQELLQFFPDELIKKCAKLKRRESVGKGRDYFLGVDIARMGEDESVFAVLERTSEKRLIHIENIITTKTRLNETSTKILELDRIYDFKKIYIDSGGIGVGVTDYLLSVSEVKRKIVEINNRDRSIEYTEKYKRKLLKEDLYNNLLGLMERGEIELLDDDELLQSFKSVQFEYVIKANSLTRLHIFGSYTHCVESLIRAAWCIKDKSLNIWCRYN